MTSRFRAHCAALAAVVCVTSVASAQESDALRQVADLNKKAIEAYDGLEVEQAAKLLREALQVCAAAGLNQHKLKARTHLNLGVVLVGGLQQRDKGIQQFRRAIEIDPTIKVAKNLSNPEIESAFAEAQTPGAPESAPVATPAPASPTPAPAAPPTAAAPSAGPPADVKGVFHQPVTEAQPGSTVSIRAAVAADLDAKKVVLAYRPEGASDFLARDMELDADGWYTARIPAVATAGGVVAYYIEARNASGTALAANGSAAEPHVISLSAADVATTGGAPAADVAATSDEPNATGRRYFLAFGVGSGAGWVKDGTPEVSPTDRNNKSISFSGFAPAQLVHFAPEFGYFHSENLILSLQGRIQLVTGASEVYDPSCKEKVGGKSVCKPAKGALAALARATWLLGDPRSLRPFVSLAAGVGEIRHMVDLGKRLRDCGPNQDQACQDTLRGGLFLFGPAAGISFAVSEKLAFVAGVNSLIGLPKSTVNFDLNLGFSTTL